MPFPPLWKALKSLTTCCSSSFCQLKMPFTKLLWATLPVNSQAFGHSLAPSGQRNPDACRYPITPTATELVTELPLPQARL